jgi:hypothetical protein
VLISGTKGPVIGALNARNTTILSSKNLNIVLNIAKNSPEFTRNEKFLAGNGGRSRIRTYDFHRVKVALYR